MACQSPRRACVSIPAVQGGGEGGGRRDGRDVRPGSVILGLKERAAAHGLAISDA